MASKTSIIYAAVMQNSVAIKIMAPAPSVMSKWVLHAAGARALETLFSGEHDLTHNQCAHTWHVMKATLLVA